MGETAAADAPANPTLIAAVRAIAARSAPLVGATLLISFAFLWLGPVGDTAWIVPILVFAGLWLVFFGLKDRADHRAMQQDGQPQPGQWIAVCGTARAVEGTQGDILACRFQVFDERSSIRDVHSKNLICRYDGFYLAPTGIETEDGTVPLAGFPDLIHLDKTPLPNDLLARAKTAAYSCPHWLPKPLAREITLADIHDRVETSLRYGDEEEASRGTTKAWILRPGDQVCVFGRWKNGTLVPSKSRPRGLPVYAGTAETVRARLSGDSSAFLILGAVLLAIAMGLAVWSLF